MTPVMINLSDLAIRCVIAAQGDGVLDSVCTNVVVPSLYARENEEDLFEENHLEYVATGFLS